MGKQPGVCSEIAVVLPLGCSGGQQSPLGFPFLLLTPWPPLSTAHHTLEQAGKSLGQGCQKRLHPDS